MSIEQILQIAQLPAMGLLAWLLVRSQQSTEKTLERLLNIIEEQGRKIREIERQVAKNGE